MPEIWSKSKVRRSATGIAPTLQFIIPAGSFGQGRYLLIVISNTFSHSILYFVISSKTEFAG